MKKSLTKSQKVAILKRLPGQVLAMQIEELHLLMKESLANKQAKADMELMHDELKSRGYTFKEVDCPKHGKELDFIPYDAKVHAPVQMKVPTLTELLAMPVPTDLPKHGYLTHT